MLETVAWAFLLMFIGGLVVVIVGIAILMLSSEE